MIEPRSGSLHAAAGGRPPPPQGLEGLRPTIGPHPRLASGGHRTLAARLKAGSSALELRRRTPCQNEPPGNRTLIGGLRIHGSTVELEAHWRHLSHHDRRGVVTTVIRNVKEPRIYLGSCSPFRRSLDQPATAIRRGFIHLLGTPGLEPGWQTRRGYGPSPFLTVNIPTAVHCRAADGNRACNPVDRAALLSCNDRSVVYPCLEAGDLAFFQAELRPH